MTGRKTKVLSCLLSFVLGVGVGVGGCRIGQEIKNNPSVKLEQEFSVDSGGMLLPEETVGNGVKLMSAKIAAADYEENGISPQAETAYTLTAAVNPSYAVNQKVDWTTAFVDFDPSLGQDDRVLEYVTVTPTSDGALTAVVRNFKEFGMPITITVRSRDNPEAYAICMVNYVKKIKSVSISDPSKNLITDNGTDWETGFLAFYGEVTPKYIFDFTYSADYTMDDMFTMTASAQIDAEFLSGLRTYARNLESAETQNAVAICCGLEGDAKNPIYPDGESWYHTACASGFFSLFYPLYEQPGIEAKKQALGMFVNYVKSLNKEKVSLIDYKVTFTGDNSAYTLAFSQVLDVAELPSVVSSVTLDRSDCLF